MARVFPENAEGLRHLEASFQKNSRFVSPEPAPERWSGDSWARFRSQWNPGKPDVPALQPTRYWPANERSEPV